MRMRTARPRHESASVFTLHDALGFSFAALQLHLGRVKYAGNITQQGSVLLFQGFPLTREEDRVTTEEKGVTRD